MSVSVEVTPVAFRNYALKEPGRNARRLRTTQGTKVSSEAFPPEVVELNDSLCWVRSMEGEQSTVDWQLGVQLSVEDLSNWDADYNRTHSEPISVGFGQVSPLTPKGKDASLKRVEEPTVRASLPPSARSYY